jgi:hypothetical protein
VTAPHRRRFGIPVERVVRPSKRGAGEIVRRVSLQFAAVLAPLLRDVGGMRVDWERGETSQAEG